MIIVNPIDQIRQFVIESNSIERIFRDPTKEEIDELIRFMALKRITIEEIEQFVSVYQPEAKLRDKPGMNVRIGSYYPPRGGPLIRGYLQNILDKGLDPYSLHVRYELIHPFMDCNGRSGRALWAWAMEDITGGFLLNFYYQSLKKESDKFGEVNP
jgi:Fic/DOC family